MRKDLKFGLTIGAVLVVTLVVYLIVLSRNSAPPAKVALGPGNIQIQSGDVPATPDSSNGMESATPLPANPSGPEMATNVNTNSPATQPAAVVVDRTDWNGALERGLPPSLSAAAAPEQTMTPTIDGPTVTLPHIAGGVTRDTSTPVIDQLPATQPAPQIAAAAPPVMNAAAPSATAARTHTVAAGESPSSIAAAVYGNAKYYKNILTANPGIDPRHLKIGQVLVIPELGAIDTHAATDASAAIDPTSAYRIISGDTLEKIARKLYGGIEMKEKLYQLNKGLIGPDEDVLKIGWVLKLPEAPKIASAAR